MFPNIRQLVSSLPRFRRAAAELPILAEREAWDRNAIEAYQLDRLNKLWASARVRVPHYRVLAEEHRLPERFETLDAFRQQMPKLAKATVRESGTALVSDSPGPGAWLQTSGSTGTPLRVYRDTAGHRESLQAKYRFHQAWGLRITDPMAWLWSSDAVSAAGLRGQLQAGKQAGFDYLRNRLRLPAARLSQADLQKHLQRIKVFKPKGMYCYSRAAHLLAREALASGFQYKDLRLVILTGEAASTAMMQTIAEAFNAPVAMEYGCVEFGFVAGQYPDGTLRAREDTTIVETAPRDDGKYDLLLTTLNNPSFPLLRYEVGDVTDAALTLPEQGFAALPNVAGRDDDLVLTQSDGVIDATTIDSLFEGEHFETVRRYRVHQSVEGGLTVELEASNPEHTPDCEAIRQRIKGLVGGFDVEVRVVERVAQTEAGKHRVVTSDRYRQSRHADA